MEGVARAEDWVGVAASARGEVELLGSVGAVPAVVEMAPRHDPATNRVIKDKHPQPAKRLPLLFAP